MLLWDLKKTEENNTRSEIDEESREEKKEESDNGKRKQMTPYARVKGEREMLR